MVSGEVQYKWVLGILATGMVLIRMYYQYLNGQRGTDRVKAPLAEHVRVGLTSLWLIPAWLYTFTPWLDGLHFPASDGLRRTGAVLQCLGIVLFWWAHQTLGRNWTPFLQIRPHHALVTTGPYHWIRHPMYAAIFLCGIGLSLISANWLVAAAYFPPVIALYATRVGPEENLLLAAFGEAYRRYQRRTGRLLPRLWGK